MPGEYITSESMRTELKEADQKRRWEEWLLLQKKIRRDIVRSGNDVNNKEYELSRGKGGISATKFNSRYGYNKKTEDRAGIFELTEQALADFTKEEIGQCLYDAVCRMVALVEQAKLKGGSTFIASLNYKANIYTVSLGDSSAMLLAKGRASNKFQGIYLNHINNTKSPNDIARIKTEGGTFNSYGALEGRNDCVFNVTGGIGDTDMADKGFNRTPYVSMIEITNKTAPALILTSDGVTDVLAKSDIEAYYDKFGDATLAEPLEQARILRCAADAFGSDDDITTVVMQLDKASNIPVVAYVADGHGGSAVSEYLHRNFAKELNIVIAKRHEAKKMTQPLVELRKELTIETESKSAVKMLRNELIAETRRLLRAGTPEAEITQEENNKKVIESVKVIKTVHDPSSTQEEKMMAIDNYSNKTKIEGWQACTIILAAVTASIVATPVAGALVAFGIYSHYKNENNKSCKQVAITNDVIPTITSVPICTN